MKANYQLVRLGGGDESSPIPIVEPSFIPADTEAMFAKDQVVDVQPRVVNPNQNQIFRLEYLFVCPIVFENGELRYLDYGYRFTTGSASNTIIRAEMSLAMQSVLKDYATSKGYETLGWYLLGSYYMDCYIPGGISYRIYRHDQNGETLYGDGGGSGSNDLALPTIFPDNTTQTYRYGLEGYANMLVYYPPSSSHPGGSSEYIYPTFAWTVDFKNS